MIEHDINTIQDVMIYWDMVYFVTYRRSLYLGWL